MIKMEKEACSNEKTARNIYLGFILFLMYAPIATLVVLSFNSSKSRSKWGGFTLKWYSSLFQDDAIMSALYNTLAIAFLSALIATIIGTCASLGITAMKAKWRTVIMGITNIPVLNSDIVTGISLMLLFIAFRFTLGFSTILIAHITFNIPYAILSVMPKLKQTNKSTYEAARDLGAGPFQAFMKVVFPDILPGVLSGFLMTFTMSLDDFIITHFTKGPGVDTLSTKIYSEVRKGIRPEMYALSTLLFLSVMVIMILMNTSPKETDSKKAGSTSKDFKRKRKIPMASGNPCRIYLINRSNRISSSCKNNRKCLRRTGNCLQLGRIHRLMCLTSLKKKPEFRLSMKNTKPMKSCILKFFPVLLLMM